MIPTGDAPASLSSEDEQFFKSKGGKGKFASAALRDDGSPIPVGLKVRVILTTKHSTFRFLDIPSIHDYLIICPADGGLLWVVWQDIVKNLHERTWSSLDLQVVQERCVKSIESIKSHV